MTRNCTRCHIPLENRGTVHLMKGPLGIISIKAHAQVCPNCRKIELVEVES